MKHRRKKPDLLVILAVIVGIGIVVTMKAQASWEKQGLAAAKHSQNALVVNKAKLNPFIQ